jgi:hypothetical protein
MGTSVFIHSKCFAKSRLGGTNEFVYNLGKGEG